VGVDRSTVVHTCRTAKQGALDALASVGAGRPGRSAAHPRRGRRLVEQACGALGGTGPGCARRAGDGWHTHRRHPARRACSTRAGRPFRPGALPGTG